MVFLSAGFSIIGAFLVLLSLPSQPLILIGDISPVRFFCKNSCLFNLTICVQLEFLGLASSDFMTYPNYLKAQLLSYTNSFLHIPYLKNPFPSGNEEKAVYK
jgi:hypothetical protein